MRKETREALDAYYSEAGSWASDRNEALAASRRVAWWVAAALGVVAVCEALALVFLAPLKTVEPYTLLVDRQTGFVQTLKPLETNLIAGDRALTQSFLVQYVIAREGFDINALQNDYRKVAFWSTGTARAEYLSGMQVSNPDSPIARLPRTTVIDVQIKTVTPLANNVAMVRYDTVRRDATGQTGQSRPWMSIVRYSYSGEPMSAQDRMINPLGFKVISYRRSAENLAGAVPTNMPAISAMPAVRSAPTEASSNYSGRLRYPGASAVPAPYATPARAASPQ